MDLYARLKTAEAIYFSPHIASPPVCHDLCRRAEDTAHRCPDASFRHEPEPTRVSFGELLKQLNNEQEKTGIKLNIANDYGQKDHPFLPLFDVARQSYGAKLEQFDFSIHAETIRTEINDWVSDKTKGKITDLIQRACSIR